MVFSKNETGHHVTIWINTKRSDEWTISVRTYIFSLSAEQPARQRVCLGSCNHLWKMDSWISGTLCFADYDYNIKNLVSISTETSLVLQGQRGASHVFLALWCSWVSLGYFEPHVTRHGCSIVCSTQCQRKNKIILAGFITREFVTSFHPWILPWLCLSCMFITLCWVFKKIDYI